MTRGRPLVYSIRNGACPELRACKACSCCYGSTYSIKDGRERVTALCSRCLMAIYKHNMNSHLEYDQYLSKGCWICGAKASRIDHDHNRGCPIVNHSCAKCRRGAVCAFCNRALGELENPSLKRQKVIHALAVRRELL